MPVEAIAIAIVAAIVLAVLGQRTRKRRNERQEGTRIIIVNNEDDVRIDGGSQSGQSRGSGWFTKFLTLLFSLGLGFLLTGFLVETFQAELGPVDPYSPLALVMYMVFGIIIYAILRLLFGRR